MEAGAEKHAIHARIIGASRSQYQIEYLRPGLQPRTSRRVLLELRCRLAELKPIIPPPESCRQVPLEWKSIPAAYLIPIAQPLLLILQRGGLPISSGIHRFCPSSLELCRPNRLVDVSSATVVRLRQPAGPICTGFEAPPAPSHFQHQGHRPSN